MTKPTAAELEILSVLWRLGPSTVRQVHAELGGNSGYTTVLKLMQIMADKGLVTRNEDERAHVYRPKQRQDVLQRHLLGELMDKAFGGSAAQLVQQALSSRRASKEDLTAIRRMLDELEGETRR